MVLKNLFKFIEDEKQSTRIIIFACAIACFFLGATNEDLYYYKQTNYSQALVGLILGLISLLPFNSKNTRGLGNIYIYYLDLSNLALIGFSSFLDKISYQYIIYFFVSSIFFKTKRSFLFCVILNNISLLLIFFLFDHINSSSITDFYISFIISAFALIVMKLNKFETEEKLQHNEEKYRILAENSADIICTHLENGNYEFMSPSFYQISGYTTEIKIYNPTQIIHPEDREKYKLAFNQSLHTNNYATVQYRLKRADGSYIWLESILKQIDNERSKILSQTRNFERTKNHLDEIESKNLKIEESYNDLEMFAYISSHDMQEPLRMIASYMQLLKRKHTNILPEDAIEYIDYAQKGANNLQLLIRDILSYSTINKKEIVLEPIDVDSLLEDVINNLHVLIEEKNVKVIISSKIDFLGDKIAIAQVFQNLIQNGIKYNTSPKPTIEISAKQINADYIEYAIKDNGIGIDNEFFEKIFEPFSRLTSKNKVQGTGLGLAICRKIIERHTGKISAQSVENNGTTFYFTLQAI